MNKHGIALIAGLAGGLILGVTLEKTYIKAFLKRKTNIYESNDHSGFIPDAVYFASSEEAADAFRKVDEVCSDYGSISIADVYEICGVDGYYEMGYYKACKLGWTSTSLFSIEHMYNNVYALRLPCAQPIDIVK